MPRVPEAHGVGLRSRRVSCSCAGPDFRGHARLHPRQRQRLSCGAPLLPRVRNHGVLVSVTETGDGRGCARLLRRSDVSIPTSAGLRTPSTHLGHADALALGPVSRFPARHESASPAVSRSSDTCAPSCGPIPLSPDGFPGAAADLPRSTREGSASKLRPLGCAFTVIATAAAH